MLLLLPERSRGAVEGSSITPRGIPLAGQAQGLIKFSLIKKPRQTPRILTKYTNYFMQPLIIKATKIISPPI